MSLRALAAISALTFALPASGHEMEIGPHGGRVMQAGDHHVELVANDAVVEVFLTDAGDKPIAATGFKGIAILVVGGKSTRVALEPTGDARLLGKAASAVPSRPVGVVQITKPDGKTAQARFD